MEHVSDLVRRCYSAYETKDRKAIEGLLSDDFTFTSPLDDHIDRATYFKRCWPNSENIRAFQIEKIFEKGNEVFVRYEGTRNDGGRWRCTEFFRIEDNKIKEVEVYFASLVTPENLKAAAEARAREEQDRAQKITPFLWFDGNAEEAANLYVSIFKNSKILSVSRYGESGPGPKGTAMSVTFQLDGQKFFALNGGPQYTFTPAVSFFVNCATQAEVDDLWEKLSAGGEKNRCGWLKDKFGLSWQIIPSALGEMLQDKDPAKSGRTMKAMLQMEKIDINKLRQAYDQA